MWQMKMFISVYTVFKDIVQMYSVVLALAALWAVCVYAGLKSTHSFFHSHQPSYGYEIQILP